ncbi:type II toxin-antitoxin system RelE/ParE family toxin [Variovorax guangxiensis]|uniref:type II toxin-antitoxin system RelE/ParE family toxin n=1 Tax=Variovorax guangxiensis TaxID=1775474 RepID=UPI002855F61D|nr:type II toxin-antitoxin system RelE/ParE family toxin [Variovorax guangxiensis]MDR6859921.1 toxin ParE1/3/4 [Variovorax guangxiensis]
MQVEISPLAEADLLEIGDYIAQDNPARAESFIDEVLEQAKKIARMPTGYAPREELAPGLRMCPHGRYILFFRIVGNVARIERVLHSARDIDVDDFPD